MINSYETAYKILANRIIYDGKKSNTRAGVARAVFGMSIAADLKAGFPVLTGKKMMFKKALHEFRWMWDGRTDVQYLHDHDIHYWDHWLTEDRKTFGPTYGYQVRTFGGQVDQIKRCHEELMNHSRRAVLTFWDPVNVNITPLPPCYTSMTFVRIGQELHMDMALRSSDVAVGLPFDVIIGAMFLTEMALMLNCTPRLLRLNLSNAHIYENCLLPMEEYLASQMFDLPEYDGISELINYQHGKFIKMPLNV